MKVIDYALVIYVVIITILGAAFFIYPNPMSFEVSRNILGVAMIFIYLLIMIIVILIKRRDKQNTSKTKKSQT